MIRDLADQEALAARVDVILVRIVPVKLGGSRREIEDYSTPNLISSTGTIWP